MNALEKALNGEIDDVKHYLQNVTVNDFRIHIAEIKQKYSRGQSMATFKDSLLDFIANYRKEGEMNSKTLKALRGSIKKWEKIVDGTGEDNGTGNCPLCKVFIDNDCEGCPVMVRTGNNDCNFSPYSDWINHQTKDHKSYHFPYKVSCPKCKDLAQSELDFLKSLLPEKSNAK